MVETRMPDPSGAPLDPAVTPPTTQYSSRREMRAAEAALAARGRRVPAISALPVAEALARASTFPAVADSTVASVASGDVVAGSVGTASASGAAPHVFAASFVPGAATAAGVSTDVTTATAASTATATLFSSLASTAALPVLGTAAALAPDSHARAQVAPEVQASTEETTAAPVTTGAAFFVGGVSATETVSVVLPADAGETAADVSKRDGASRRSRGIRFPLRSSRGVKAAAFSANGPTNSAATASAAEPTRTRKNPFSVLVTMLAVTGLFAVAALPAYGLTIDPVASDAVAATAAVKDTIVPVQSLSIGAVAAPVETVRDGFTATTREQLDALSRSSAKAAACSAYYASGSTNIGDDYPWPCELSDDEGGGLSPLNYFYRECVDFVAWRLNRDAGSYEAPFTFVWSNLTPSGGNASQWRYAWESHGWATSSTPAVGWVAWFNGNHVAYVSAVNADGTVLIEEYNHGSNHKYGQRTIPATDVALFLSPPPR